MVEAHCRTALLSDHSLPLRNVLAKLFSITKMCVRDLWELNELLKKNHLLKIIDTKLKLKWFNANTCEGGDGEILFIWNLKRKANKKAFT